MEIKCEPCGRLEQGKNIRSARAESHCGNDDYMNPECSDLGVGYYGTAVIEKDLCEKVSGFLAAARHGEH